VANSLILDGDVDVKNDYLSGRYHEYYQGRIQPHVNRSIFTADSPHWYSMHGIGLSAVLVPAVAADGARGATVAMVVIAVVVLLLAFLWVRRFTGGVWLAAIAVAALGLSPSFLGLEGRVFPDLPVAPESTSGLRRNTASACFQRFPTGRPHLYPGTRITDRARRDLDQAGKQE
jgi:hypothetical protein